MNNRQRWLALIVLGVTMFVTGLTGIVFEYVLSTVATYVLGNSVEQFAITIGLMLFFMGLGGFSQKFFPAKSPVVAFVTVELVLAMIGGFSAIVMYAAFGTFESHFKLIQYGIAASVGMLVGCEIPFAIRIYQQYSTELRDNLAAIFLTDYLGAFVGAILFSKYLLPRFSLTEIPFLLSGMLLFVSLLNFAFFGGQFKFRTKLGFYAAFASVSAALFVGYTHNKDWNAVLEQRLYRDRIVHAQTTPYQRMVLAHNPDKDQYSLYLNGNLQFSSLDEGRYHDFLIHVPMLFRPNHSFNVLVLGGGDGLGLREILKYPNLQSVTLVDLDPGMVQFASTNLVMTRLNRNAFANAKLRILESGAVKPGPAQELVVDGERSLRAKRDAPESMKVGDVRVINLDADKFIDEINDVYDIVIIDFPDPKSIELGKLYSKEFYLKLRRVVAESGMVAIQSTSVYYSREPFMMIGRTMEAAGFNVLPYHHEVPSFGDWGYHLAWKNGRSKDEIVAQLKSRQPLGVPTDYINASLIANSVDFGNNELHSKFAGTINTYMQPMLIGLYQKSWVVD